MQAPSAGGAAISTSYRRASGRASAGKSVEARPTSIPTIDEIKASTAALERAFPTPDDSPASVGDVAPRAPNASEATSRGGRAHQAAGAGVATPRKAASSSKAGKLKTARAAMTEAEKQTAAKRGRPKTVENRKAYKAQKEAERRARVKAQKDEAK